MSLGGISMSTEKVRVVKQVAAEAIKSRDLDGALRKFGQGLSTKEISALKTLTLDELDALASIDAKLAPLGLSSLY
jgi:hypothetical protein